MNDYHLSLADSLANYLRTLAPDGVSEGGEPIHYWGTIRDGIRDWLLENPGEAQARVALSCHAFMAKTYGLGDDA